MERGTAQPCAKGKIESMEMSSGKLLACDLSVTYGRSGAGVSGIKFDLARGEIFGIAGESGSGKSTIALALMGLARRRGAHASGTVLLEGRDLLSLPEREVRRLRGRTISMVSQSAASALNPALRLRTHFREVWRAHRNSGDWAASAAPVLNLLGVPATPQFLDKYPFELSVGMAQRVLVALALLHDPSLLIADEPTSALDLVTQADLLGLFADLRARRALSIIFISHDLLALASVCDRMAVLRSGRLVEILEGPNVLAQPKDEYTKRLIGALDRMMPGNRIISGTGSSSVQDHYENGS
jgi:ABC-type dipeptide/oligopeptide/nickel transport system ATPase component